MQRLLMAICAVGPAAPLPVSAQPEDDIERFGSG